MPQPASRRRASRPIPTAYKGYERREAAQRAFTFETYYPGRVVMGGPKQAIERIRVLRDVGITQVGLLVDFGSLPQAEIMRSLQGVRRTGAAARARLVTPSSPARTVAHCRQDA